AGAVTGPAPGPQAAATSVAGGVAVTPLSLVALNTSAKPSKWRVRIQWPERCARMPRHCKNGSYAGFDGGEPDPSRRDRRRRAPSRRSLDTNTMGHHRVGRPGQSDVLRDARVRDLLPLHQIQSRKVDVARAYDR